VGVLLRPFVLERDPGPRTIAPAAVTAASLAFASSLPKFVSARAIRPSFLTLMLDLVEKRSPTLKDALVEARAGRYGPAALEAFTTGDQPAADFFPRIDFFA